MGEIVAAGGKGLRVVAKQKIHFVCQECGYDSTKWLGRCPACEAWNTMVEEVVAPATTSGGKLKAAQGKPVPLTEIDTSSVPRLTTGIGEFDRVLGGGLVPGALVLIGGDPGIGKSTLLLQVALGLTRTEGTVLYVSGEESAPQIRMRAERLGPLVPQLLILTETNLDVIVHEAARLRPALMVVDSVQTMFCQELPSAPGSVGQVRETTAKLLRLSKETAVPIAIIGHVTKDGNIAGPRLLEHMVDVVLYLEGERSYAFRVLRAMKNRFGATTESGIFSMEETGMTEVRNPSAQLLSERPEGMPGSVVLACLEGIRPLLLELQALVSPSYFGMPRRTAAGVDFNRLTLLLAVLEKRVGMVLGNQDVYVNAVGGIRINEPAADLAVMLAVASGLRNRSVEAGTVVMGEVGLTGEVRMVPRADLRIGEGISLGFKKYIVPAGNLAGLKNKFPGVTITGVSTVAEAMEAVML